MRSKGINYDTGFRPGGYFSREQFDPDVVGREMQIIASELNCTSVRITGAEPARLTVAAEVVLVTGCELSLFGADYLPGSTVFERLAGLSGGGPELHAAFAAMPERLNGFLADTALAARGRFGGRITYASGTWEPVDWTPFDIVSVDAYRDLLPVFEEAGVDTAFWFTFAGYAYPHTEGPREDLDLASYGVVKMLADGAAAPGYGGLHWEPKLAFAALAKAYAAS